MTAQELKKLKHTLRFNTDGNFRILMMTDIHGGVGCSKQIHPAIEAVVEEAKPDLVLLGGDTAGPGKIHVETTEQVRDLLNTVTEPMERRKIPWAHVFGNHDNNFGVSNAEQQAVYESFPYCVSKYGEKDIHGVANYVLPILRSDSDKIAFNVFGLDSHRAIEQFREAYSLPESINPSLPKPLSSGCGWGFVHFDQIMWYYNASKALEELNGAKIPALMYMHIPVPELYLISQNREECGFTGTQHEGVECSELNTGLFTACLERGDVKAIFFGHDHINDFYGEYCGIKLGYAAGMDYDAYQEDEMRGARLFEINENNPWDISTKIIKVRDLLGEAGNRFPPR